MKNRTRVLYVAAFASILVMASQATAQSAENKALLHSPRYLEEHPELLRPAQGTLATRSERSDRLTANAALAKSPRYLEEHPELRWSGWSAPTVAPLNEGLAGLTENEALLHSPRYLENHPELLRSEPTVELAPLK